MDELLNSIGIPKSELIVPSTWNEDMIIRYFYVKFAKYFKRDMSFFMASSEERETIYSDGFKFKGSEVVCQTISEFYCQLYNMFGIKTKLVTTNNKQVPHYALMVEGTKGWYCIDPLKDLFSNQLGIKTTFFAHIPKSASKIIYNEYPFLIGMTLDEVKELDHETGLLVNGYYMDDFFDYLSKEFTDVHKFAKTMGIDKNDYLAIILAKIEFIRTKLINLGNINGTYERNTYYKYLSSQLFNRREINASNVQIIQTSDNYTIAMDVFLKDYQQYVIRFVEIEENGYNLIKLP